MSNVSLDEFEQRLDDLTTALLLPLRTSKVLDAATLKRFKQLLSELATALATDISFRRTSSVSFISHFRRCSPKLITRRTRRRSSQRPGASRNR
jgi:hypothetical protein